MSDSIDPLDDQPFEAKLEYHLEDRVAGRKHVVQNLAPPKPEEEPAEKPAEKPEESSYHLWDERRKLGLMFGRVYILMMVIFLGVLSIYWGSLYHREDRVRNIKMLVVIEDHNVLLTNGTSVSPVIGPAFRMMLEASPEFGDFVFADIDALNATAALHNRTIFAEVGHNVHDQDYWAGLYINGSASQVAYDMFISGNSLSVAASEIQYVISAVYESGRHFSALSQYVTKNMRLLEEEWLSLYAPGVYGVMVKSYLTGNQRQTLIQASNSTNTSSALSNLPGVNMVDLRPAASAAVLGPSELGLIYAQIFSFHQFNFLVDLHNSIRDKLRFRHYVTYRILFSQLNHFVLALVYSLMTIAFQVPIDLAYGGVGFLILWITMFLFISASGGISECYMSIVLYKDKKVLLAPFMIFYIVINISPTFAPFVLSPGFYRYGYTMPMFNCYEALKVLFFNTWRGTLGRNYAILGAWVVVSNATLVYILWYISKKTKAKRLLQEKEKSEKK